MDTYFRSNSINDVKNEHNMDMDTDGINSLEIQQTVPNSNELSSYIIFRSSIYDFYGF